MKQTGIRFPAILVLLTFMVPAWAQPVFFVSDTVVEQGTSFNVEIQVESFSNIVGVQFSVDWDSTVLKYLDVQNFSLDIDEENNFGTTNTQSGVLSFSWFDGELSGKNMEDSSALFSISFEAIGAFGSASAVNFSDDPTVREVADTSFNSITAVYQSGTVRVDDMNTSVFNSAPEEISIAAAFPNPFSEETQIQFAIKKTTKVSLSIHNIHGQLVYEEQRQFSSGSHTITLGKDIFPQVGAYYFQMRAPHFLVTQKLMRL